MHASATHRRSRRHQRRHDRRRRLRRTRGSRTISRAAPLSALLEAGEARTSFKHLALHHADGRRWLLVGLGAPRRASTPSARGSPPPRSTAARASSARATLCWELPHHVPDDVAAALVEGTILAGLPLRPLPRAPRGRPPRELDEVVVSAPSRRRRRRARAAPSGPTRQNFARELQDTPANDLTPTRAGRARARRDRRRRGRGPRPRVDGRAGHGRVPGRRPGLRPRAGGHRRALRRRRRRPAARARRQGGDPRHRRPVDQAGGEHARDEVRHVRRRRGARRRCGRSPQLELPVRVLAVVGATENTINGSAMKPGDIVRAMTGTTIEVNNTDAEGRLVLCDCLAYAVAQGAERIVDVATLTGGIVTALGSTYAGLLRHRRGAGRGGHRRRRGRGRDRVAACRCTPSTTSRSRAATPTSSNSDEPQGAPDPGRLVPQALRRRRAVGAPRHRRHRPRQRPRLRGQGRRRAGACGSCWSWRARTRKRSGPRAVAWIVPHPARAGRTTRSLLGALATTAMLLVGAAPAMADSASISVAATGGQLDPVAYMSRVFTVSGTATGRQAPLRQTSRGGRRRLRADGLRRRGNVARRLVLRRGRERSVQSRADPRLGQARHLDVLLLARRGREHRHDPEHAGRHLPRARRHDRGRRLPRGPAARPARPDHGGGHHRVVAARVREDPLGRRPSVREQLRRGPRRRIRRGWSVDGAFSINANTTEAEPGTYLICLWLAGDSADSLPIGGVRQQTYAVVRPPTPSVSSIAIINCRTGKHLKLIRAHATTSVCMRYRFSTPPAAGLSVVGGLRHPRATSCTRW